MFNITNHWLNVNENHRDITSHLLGCILSKRQEITSVGGDEELVGEDVEKRGPLWTVGGNVNWHSHYGKQYGGYLRN